MTDSVAYIADFPLEQFRQHGIPEELAKAKNVQWRQFNFWLERRSADELAAADTEALAFSYSPLAQWEIEQIIGVRIKALRRRK
jgi:hypothetical protein